MNTTKTELKFKPFNFWEEDESKMLCHDMAKEQIKKMYPEQIIDSCDAYLIWVLDQSTEDYNEIAAFTTGRMGTGGPLAMRNEYTEEVFILCQNPDNENETICQKAKTQTN